MPFGSTTTRGNRVGSLRTQVGEYVDAAFLNAPNHSSTRRRSLRRASASMMSTSEKSKVPSVGSLSAQLTGESTTLEPTRLDVRERVRDRFGRRGRGVEHLPADEQRRFTVAAQHEGRLGREGPRREAGERARS